MKQIILVFAVSVATAAAQSPMRTSVSKEDARWNWYATLENVFDSAGVEYTVGEFALHNGSTTTRVYLDLTAEEWYSNGASSKTELAGTGQPLWHADHGRTRPFTMPASGTLTFFRLWSAYLHGTIVPTERSIVHTNSWADVRWTIGSGRLTDTMEVALWLVDAYTGTYITTIDSVGMVDRLGQPTLQRYGSSPDRCTHSFTLPSGMEGRLVEVRVIGYRRGTTQAGLHAGKRPTEVNLSALYANEWQCPFPTVEPRWLSDSFADTISMVHLAQLTQAHMAAQASTGCTPALLGFRSLPQGREPAYQAMVAALAANVYSPECILARRADTLWWLGTLSPSSSAQQKTGAVGAKTSADSATVQAVLGADGSLVVSVTGLEPTSASYMLYAVSGRLLSQSTIEVVPVTNYTIHVGNVPEGPIYMRLRTRDGRELSTFVLR